MTQREPGHGRATWHPSPEALDGYLDSLLRDPDPVIGSHVNQCPSCTAIVDELRLVRGRLSAFSAFTPELPEHWDQLVRGAMDEARVTPGTAQGTAPQTGAGAATRRRHRGRRLLAAASIIGLGAIGVPALINLNQQGSSSTAGGPQFAGPDTAGQSQRETTTGQDATAAHLDPSGTSQPATASSLSSVAAQAAGVATIASGRHYTRATVASQLRAALSDAGAGSVTAAQASRPGSQLSGRAGSCPPATAARQPLMVDHARYDGRPAVVTITRSADGRRYDAIIQFPDCSLSVLHNL